MSKKDSCSRPLDIWEDVLKKNVKSNLLKKADTVPQRTPPYDVQIFELLVAESLNLQDRHTRWEVTQASHDRGIDLLGTEDDPCRTPFTTTQYRLLSVGQVKRSKGSYKYEDLRADIRKARGYWLNSELFNGHSPKQFLFILSTDGKNGVQVLQKHLDRDLAQNTDILLKNDQLAHVQFIDASLIIKSWKFNLRHFDELLEDALSPAQMACFHEYVTGLDCSWITVSIQAQESGGLGEPIIQTILIEVPPNTLTLDLSIKWLPPSTYNIQLLHPLKMIDPRESGLTVHVQEKTEIPMTMRALSCGTRDFGTVQVYSGENTLVAAIPLKLVEIHDGFSPLYFGAPCHDVLQSLKMRLADSTPRLSSISVSGSGGVGKSSLISEAMVYAAQLNYMIIDIQQPKDLLHPRYLLHGLFTNLLRPGISRSTLLPDISVQLRRYLGCNFRDEWDVDIKNFFDCSDSEIQTQSLVECLVSLLLMVSQECPVFLWISNMHWADRETLVVLRTTVELLNIHQDMLGSHVFILFEGRSGESLLYENRPYYPIHWERLLTDNLIKNYPLSLWSREQSREFIKQLFVDPKDNPSLYNVHFEQLLDCVGGTPMHILELVRIQLEQHILESSPDHQYQLRIVRFQTNDTFWAASIQDAIDRRIHFYREKCSDLVDFCAILAALDNTIPAFLSARLIRWLHTEHMGMSSMMFQSGFLSQIGEDYRFCHEHYQSVFRLQRIKNINLLQECFAYYEQLPIKRSQDKYAEIRLHLLSEKHTPSDVRRDILSLLNSDIPQTIEQSLYRLLLELPPLLDDEDISNCKVLFQLCETYIRQGSWKSGQECLEQLLRSPPERNVEDLLIHVKSFQELSNILADRLLFDASIQAAENGLELAELCIEGSFIRTTKQQSDLFHVEREKLLARLAVCYWFAGDTARAITIQRQCYDLAVVRKDIYSAGHVLYEIGTLALHFNVDAGVAIMENVLHECVTIPNLEQYERTLIETQLLMGRLLKAHSQMDNDALHRVRLDCRRLLELNRTSPHTYERFLCLTMRGICAILEEQDIIKAQEFFFESLRCAVESDMPNLGWKALFHIAQISAHLDEGDPSIYVKEVASEIKRTIEASPRLQGELAQMFAPVLEKLRYISGEYPSGNISPPEIQTMISVSYDDFLFVIMN